MRARQLFCVCACVCVTLMDAPMERRTDAWADLTAGSGGAAHTVAARFVRKTSSICGETAASQEEGRTRSSGFVLDLVPAEKLLRCDSLSGRQSCLRGY